MKTASHTPAAGKLCSMEIDRSVLERRAEERVPAQGEVFIQVLEPRHVVIIAHLEDVSEGGFRASHESALLETGQQVFFNHPGASGTARVAWNRAAEGKWQSGFFILK